METIDITHILNALSSISNCQTTTKVLFGSCFTDSVIQKGQLVSLPTERTLYFLASGILHEYFEDSPSSVQHKNEKNRELKTIRFHQAGSFFPGSNISCNVPELTSRISALCDSRLYFCRFHKIIHCYQQDPSIAELFLYIQDQWNKKLNNELMLLHQEPALARLKQFRSHFPYPYQIPQKHIASYLHISRKHLGRLSRQLLKSN